MSGQQESVIIKKKSKCRGNQRLQRFRRQCRAKGWNVNTIGQLALTSAPSDVSARDMNETTDHAMPDVPNRMNQVRTTNDEFEARWCLLILFRWVLRASINVSKVIGHQ